MVKRATRDRTHCACMCVCVFVCARAIKHITGYTYGGSTHKDVAVGFALSAAEDCSRVVIGERTAELNRGKRDAVHLTTQHVNGLRKHRIEAYEFAPSV